MSQNEIPSAIRRACACGCGRSFVPPPSAPHKRFASAQCRNDFHTRDLQSLRELLQRKKEADARIAKANDTD